MNRFVKLLVLIIALSIILLLFPSAHICITGLSAYVAVGLPILFVAWLTAFSILRGLPAVKLAMLIVFTMFSTSVIWIVVMWWREFHILCW